MTPPRPRAPAIAGLGLALLLVGLFWPVVARDRTLSPASQIDGMHDVAPTKDGRPRRFAFVDPGASAWVVDPLGVKVRREIAAGRWPLWNEHAAAGMPLAAEMQSGAFFPPRLLQLAFGGAWAADVYRLLRLWVAGLFTYLFLRRLGLRGVACVAGGVAMMLTGHFLRYVNMGHLDVEVLLPVLLWSVEGWTMAPTRRRLATVGGVAALVTLGGMPESTFLVLATASLYAVVRRPAAGSWAPAVAAQCLGVGVAGLLLLPFAELLAHAWTQHAASGRQHLGLDSLVLLVLPAFFGDPGRQWAPAPSTLPYLGAVVVWAAWCVAPRPDQRRVVAFFLGAQVLLALKLFGLLVNDLGALPVLRHVILPKYGVVPLAMATSVLAGFGVDAIARGALARIRALVAAVPVLAGGAWAVLSQRDAMLAVPDGGDALRACLVHLALVAAAVVVAIVPGPAVARAWIVAATIAVELALPVRWDLPPRGDELAPSPLARHLAQRVRPGRDRVFVYEGMLFPNVLTAAGLDDARLTEAMIVERYHRYVRTLLHPTFGDKFTGHERPRLEPWSPALARMSVRWLARREAAPGLFPEGFLPPASAGSHVARTELTLDGVARSVVYVHPPSTVYAPFRVLPPGARLRFWLGMDPRVHERTAGARYVASVLEPAAAARVAFAHEVVPARDGRDHAWREGRVVLPGRAGDHVRLRLRADPTGSPSYAWGGWRGLRLETRRGSVPLAEDVLRQPSAGPYRIVANGSLLMQHAPSVVDVPLRLPEDGAALAFTAGLEPAAWGLCEGVRYSVEVTPLRETHVHEADLAPRAAAADRGWRAAELDLGAWSSRSVSLAFGATVRTGQDDAFAWGGFGDVTLSGREMPHTRVGHDTVLENPDAWPRARLVHRAEIVDGPDASIARLADPAFPWGEPVVVVEGAPAHSLPANAPAPSEVEMLVVEPQRLAMRVHAPANGLLVVRDTHYPGWTATVDGEPAPILPADHAFRAVSVPAGLHLVEMRYAPASFRLGLAVSAASLIALAALVRRAPARSPGDTASPSPPHSPPPS